MTKKRVYDVYLLISRVIEREEIINTLYMQRTHDTTHDTPFVFRHLFITVAKQLGHTKDTLKLLKKGSVL